jgi:hypothetical protein
MDAKPRSVSQAGQAMIDRLVAARHSPEYLTFRLMEARTVPTSGRVDTIEIIELRRQLAAHYGRVEDKINDFAKALYIKHRPDETLNDRYYRQAAGIMAMRSLETAAVVSHDPHELDYIMMAVREQRCIVLKLAENPYISEKTQLAIAHQYRDDPYVGRALAANPNIAPDTARVVARNFREDRFVMHQLGDTVSKLARMGPNDGPYAEVCREMTTVENVEFPLAPAITGVTSSVHLRTLWKQHSRHTTVEKNLDHATYHAIAQNPKTPDDVILEMSKAPPLVAEFGREAVVTKDVLRRRVAEMHGGEHDFDAMPRPALGRQS